MTMFFLFGTAVNPDRLREHIEIVLEAAQIPSIEKLAVVLEIDEGQLRRQISGEGHVSLTRMVANLDPAAFWPRYGWLLSCRFGLPREAQRAWRLGLALVGRKRQLRMTDASAGPRRRSA